MCLGIVRGRALLRECVQRELHGMLGLEDGRARREVLGGEVGHRLRKLDELQQRSLDVERIMQWEWNLRHRDQDGGVPREL